VGFAYFILIGIGVALDNVVPVTELVPNWLSVAPVIFTLPFEVLGFWNEKTFPTPIWDVVPTLANNTITLSLKVWLPSDGFIVVVILLTPVKYLSLVLNSFNFWG